MAIRSIQDLGGLGRLAQTILKSREIEAAKPAQELRRRILEGQLAESDRASQERTRTAETGRQRGDLERTLVNLIAESSPEVGPPEPRDFTTRDAARAIGGSAQGTLADVGKFNTAFEASRPDLAPTKERPQSAFQKGASFLASDEDGNQIIIQGSFDPNTNTVTALQAPLPDGFSLVSRIGETAGERQTREVETAGGKAGAVAEVKLATEPEIKKATTVAEIEARIEKEPELEKKKALAREAAKASNEAVNQIATIRGNLQNYDNAIRAINSGASTGAITKLFPSFRTSSIELDTAQRALGLDVVGSVTFGALSKGELDLALATALPLSLEGPELIDWINRKKDVQIKMSNILQEAALFLSQPGNTRADWLAANKAITPEGGVNPLTNTVPVQNNIVVDF